MAQTSSNSRISSEASDCRIEIDADRDTKSIDDCTQIMMREARINLALALMWNV